MNLLASFKALQLKYAQRHAVVISLESEDWQTEEAFCFICLVFLLLEVFSR